MHDPAATCSFCQRPDGPAVYIFIARQTGAAICSQCIYLMTLHIPVSLRLIHGDPPTPTRH